MKPHQIAPVISRILLGVVALLLGATTATSQAQDHATFGQRRQWILDTVTANPEAWLKANRQTDNPFFAATACFARGLDD